MRDVDLASTMTGDCGLECDFEKLTECWVFGYGSILWNPGFSYSSRHTGYVDGYARRFWQGSTTHRGSPHSPGRVATLIQRKGDRVWGAAFHVVGTSMVEACLRHLGVRECQLGGYEVLPVTFVSAETNPSSESLTHNNDTTGQSTSPNDDEFKSTANARGCRQAWAFVATPDNKYYLGPASVDELALQVVNSSGSSGPNFEYVTRLADYVRKYIPQDTDVHLFKLDAKIRQLLAADLRNCPSSSDVNAGEIFRPDDVTSLLPKSSSTESTPALAPKSFEENEDQQITNESATHLIEQLNYGTSVISATAVRLAINTSVVSVRAC